MARAKPTTGPRLAADAGLEAGIDALYAGSPGEFVAGRRALEQQLRASGHRELAERVKALQKPNASAWAVNQAWWRARDDFEAMLKAGEALRAAQMEALRGRDRDVRAAVARRDEAVAKVAAAALAGLEAEGGEPSDAVRRKTMATLEALATSGVPEGVRLGRLTGDLSSTGLDVLSAFAASLPPAPESSRAAARPAKQPRSAATEARQRAPAPSPQDSRAAREKAARVDAARSAAAQADAALEEAGRGHQAAQRRTADARDAQKAAEARADALEAELSAARSAAIAAAREAAAAAREEEKAAQARQRAVAQAERAHAQLEALEGDPPA